MAKMPFNPEPRILKDLIKEVEKGKLSFKFQRKFRWKDAKVCDLLDSMYRGYPIGSLTILELPDKRIIVDGQQRLSSLFAIMQKKIILDEKLYNKPIISFNPLNERFKEGNKVIKRDAEWIYDISEVFLNETRILEYIMDKINLMSESRERAGLTLNDSEKQKIQKSIMNILALENYVIPVL